MYTSNHENSMSYHYNGFVATIHFFTCCHCGDNREDTLFLRFHMHIAPILLLKGFSTLYVMDHSNVHMEHPCNTNERILSDNGTKAVGSDKCIVSLAVWSKFIM